MIHINIDIVLLAVVIDAILFNLACIQIPLLQSIWVFVPTFRHAILFDFLVVFSAIPLPWNWNHYCVDNLTTTALEALGSEESLEHFKELFDHFGLAKPFSEKS